VKFVGHSLPLTYTLYLGVLCLNLQNEKEIYEIKKIAHIMKEEFNKDMESLRLKNQTEIY
jgi:hypothetical protein